MVKINILHKKQKLKTYFILECILSSISDHLLKYNVLV